MPTLASMSKDIPSIRIGSATAARSRAATSRAAAASLTEGSSTANSSPPSRATMSPGRTLWVSRWATNWSSRSPTGCPRVSLTSLKRSRSSSRNPTVAPVRAAWASASLVRRISSLRFDRPVSSSWWAWCSRCTDMAALT